MQPHEPWVLGHRGAPRVARENTLPAFRAAFQQEADGVELDTRLSGSGDLVVCHDTTLRRLAGASVRVATTSTMALARWDLGDGARVPTLAAVLDALPPGARLNIEVKTDDGDPIALARAVAIACARRNGRGPAALIVSSFDPRVLVELRRIAPRIARGLLLPRPSDGLAAWDVPVAARHALPDAMHPFHGDCTAERVAAWRARGLAVNVWTVDDPARAVELARWGVHSIISNEPGRVLAALRAEGLR